MSVDRQIAATAAGNAWIALIQVVFIPVYIDLLGLEAYGLIGLYGVLQMAIVVLDMGLTPTMSRAAAHVMAGTAITGSVRNLLRSLEGVLLLAAIAILAIAQWAAPAMAGGWLRVASLETSTAIDALRLMAALIAVRLFMGVHRGVIVGSQQFAWFNGTAAVFATLRGAGVIPLLWWHPTIETFFAQQLAFTLAEAVVMRSKAWRLLPGSQRATFSIDELRGVRRFAGGLALMTAATLVISQADKVVSSALLPLAQFGYYALASSVASALALLLAPVGSVAFPRLNGLVARQDPAAVANGFHELAQWTTLAVVPAGLVLAVFSYEVLFAWTGNTTTSAATAPLLAVLALGGLLNGLLHLPCLLPIARGETSIPTALAIGLALLFVPTLYLVVSAWGAIAAAYAWLAVNACALALAVGIPQRGMGWTDRWRWFVFDALVPACAAAAGVMLVQVLLQGTGAVGRRAAAGAILLAGAVALLGAALTVPEGRRVVRGLVEGLTRRRK